MAMASIRSRMHLASPLLSLWRRIPTAPSRVVFSVRCAASKPDGGKKVSSRLSLMQGLMHEAEERSLSAGSAPIPKLTLDHVTVSYARSGGPGGQNVNKVNTKVDMRFNVNQAQWLSERVRDRILQMEKKPNQQRWGDCYFFHED